MQTITSDGEHELHSWKGAIQSADADFLADAVLGAVPFGLSDDAGSVIS